MGSQINYVLHPIKWLKISELIMNRQTENTNGDLNEFIKAYLMEFEANKTNILFI